VMYTAKFRLHGRIIQIKGIPQKNIPAEFFNIPNNPPNKLRVDLTDYSVFLYEGPLSNLNKRFKEVNNAGKTLIFVYEIKTNKGVVRGILIPKDLDLNRVNFF